MSVIRERSFHVPPAAVAASEELLGALLPTEHVLITQADGSARLAIYLSSAAWQERSAELAHWQAVWGWQDLGEQEQDSSAWLAEAGSSGPIALADVAWIIDAEAGHQQTYTRAVTAFVCTAVLLLAMACIHLRKWQRRCCQLRPCKGRPLSI